MASFPHSSPQFRTLFKDPFPSNSSLPPSHLKFHRKFHFHAVETVSDGGRVGSLEMCGHDLTEKKAGDDVGDKGVELEKESVWADWEDRILGDTVPLVGFVRTILHSQLYKSGERLSPEHEKTITKRLLPYHPRYEMKIGCGIDHIMVDNHPQFRNSRCLFIVRKDGELVDFSYWKCIKGLIRTKYPLYADSFIHRHLVHRRHNV